MSKPTDLSSVFDIWKGLSCATSEALNMQEEKETK